MKVVVLLCSTTAESHSAFETPHTVVGVGEDIELRRAAEQGCVPLKTLGISAQEEGCASAGLCIMHPAGPAQCPLRGARLRPSNQPVCLDDRHMSAGTFSISIAWTLHARKGTGAATVAMLHGYCQDWMTAVLNVLQPAERC